MLIVRSLYQTRSVPNEDKEKGMGSISECGLRRVGPTGLCDRRSACHVLGVPGQGIAKCEHRADLDEDTREELMFRNLSRPFKNASQTYFFFIFLLGAKRSPLGAV